MADISSLPIRHAKAGNEERSSYYPQGAPGASRFENRPGGSGTYGNFRGGNAAPNSAEKNKKLAEADFDASNVIQIRSDTSSTGLNGQNLKSNRLKKQQRKLEEKRLRKLHREADNIEGFLSCGESQGSMIEALKTAESEIKRHPEESRSQGHSQRLRGN